MTQREIIYIIYIYGFGGLFFYKGSGGRVRQEEPSSVIIYAFHVDTTIHFVDVHTRAG